MSLGASYRHFTAANQTALLGGVGGGTKLRAVNVNTAAASAVVTIYDGTTSNASSVAIIDASTVKSNQYRDITSPNGLFAALTGGNADVTISYI